MEVRIAETSYVGLHLFCRMSRQIPPSAYTFGWNIFDTKRTVGGLFGYSSVNSIVSLKVPSSNGVSCGPNITAFQIMMLLSVGAPETPVGGSSWSLLKSRIRRLRAGVDILLRHTHTGSALPLGFLREFAERERDGEDKLRPVLLRFTQLNNRSAVLIRFPRNRANQAAPRRKSSGFPFRFSLCNFLVFASFLIFFTTLLLTHTLSAAAAAPPTFRAPG